jgi:hypothetical protein
MDDVMPVAQDPPCDFAGAVRDRIRQFFGGLLPRPEVTAIIAVIGALIPLAVFSRGWYGRLTLCGIARSMAGKATVKSRFKRLSRLLSNARFNLDKAMPGLASFSGLTCLQDLTTVLIDQTSLCKDTVQAVFASIVYGCRSIPIALKTFEYCDIKQSQTAIEWQLIQSVIAILDGALNAIFVMDRGYAKYFLLHELKQRRMLFIIRGCRNVKVEYHDNRGAHCVGLGRLPHRQGVPIRYRNVRYKDGAWIIVDIVVFHGRGFDEPWFLIVPSGCEDRMPTDKVVQWYRWRMRIEHTFRDFKSCLGIRKGLHLEPGSAQRMARMLLCVAIVYIILIAMGETDTAQRMRKAMEIRRRKPRHGTRRTLSVLSIALLVLSQVLYGSRTSPFLLLHELMTVWSHGLLSMALGPHPDT